MANIEQHLNELEKLCLQQRATDGYDNLVTSLTALELNAEQRAAILERCARIGLKCRGPARDAILKIFHGNVPLAAMQRQQRKLN